MDNVIVRAVVSWCLSADYAEPMVVGIKVTMANPNGLGPQGLPGFPSKVPPVRGGSSPGFLVDGVLKSFHQPPAANLDALRIHARLMA